MNNETYKWIEIIDNSESYVVFLMGIVIHKPLNIFVRHYIKRSLKAILGELDQKKPEGFLNYLQTTGNPRLLVLYWKDMDTLYKYARDKTANHFPAWFEFNDKISKTRGVGLWHEIYQLPAGSYSGIYRHCPLTGMSHFTKTNRLGIINAS